MAIDKMKNSRWSLVASCIFLIALTWVVFGQTFRHQFINYDDPLYVLDNAHVRAGLTWHGIEWAFTHVHSQNWHPLTTISHMLDCQLFGLNPGAHHLVNVFWHSVAALLLFIFLQQTTGSVWRSAFVAGLFTIHPLRVESVAWIAERKDVLSGAFFMLTLLAYVRYTRAPSVSRYVLLAILFACGLLSKPMLVTLPFVLLLLDYWPLRRFAESSSFKSKSKTLRWWDRQSIQRRLILEKIPFLAFSPASSRARFLVQRQAAGSIDQLPFAWRVNNAIVTCVAYIWQMLWPVKLAVF